MQDKRLIGMLNQYWQKIVDDLVKSLYDVGRVASGATAQSIADGNTNPITITSNGFRIQIAMPTYYQFIDEGVSGAEKNKGISRFSYKSPFSWKNAPPISAVRKFMLNRGISKFSDIKAKRSYTRKNTKSGKRRDAEAIRNSIAFAVSYNIWKYGLDKTNFYSNVINDKELLDFERKLLDQYRKYIIDIIRVE
jgi:hypothetical protein